MPARQNAIQPGLPMTTSFGILFYMQPKKT